MLKGKRNSSDAFSEKLIPTRVTITRQRGDLTYVFEIDGFKGPTGHTIYFHHTTFLDISSSRMRTMAQTGNSLRYLTPDNVRNYIIKNSLYRKE